MIEAAQEYFERPKDQSDGSSEYPAADGMQHDECRGLVFRYANKIDRKIDTDATLHSLVYERFKLPAVLQYDLMLPYRPEGCAAM